MGVSLLCDCTVEGSNFPNEERGHVHRKKLTETDKGNTLPQSVELKEVGNKEEKPLNALFIFLIYKLIYSNRQSENE